jgi:riboflavin-specific deaminase-like protein
MGLHRIYPEPATLDPEGGIAGLRWADLAPPERPYIALNMVSTADGKAAVEGRTRAISSETDRAIFHNLRTQADAVMAGAGTVRSERYGPIVKTEELRAKREREGLDPHPLAVIVSGSLQLPVDVPLFQDPDSRVVILTHSPAELEGARAQVSYLRSEGGTFDLRPLMERLRSEHGVRSVLCEGGPAILGDLVRAGLVDELHVVIAPLLAAGEDPLTIVTGPQFEPPAGLRLLSVHESGGYLFLRYGI